LSKQLFKKELILFNWSQNQFQFYRVEVLSVGYNELQLIVSQGKLGNKGKETVTRMNELKKAMKTAHRKINDKEDEGYIEREKAEKALVDFQSKKSSKRQPSAPKHKKLVSSYKCDACKKSIPETSYTKINEWARGEGNWDSDKEFIGFQKVFCLDCQKTHDVYKKKF